MDRTSIRPVLAVALTAAILGFVGCHSRPAATPAAKPASGTPGVSQPAPTKRFADWPTPVGALVISGEQNGYLEPCGCTEGQTGGLGRRYDLLERLRAKGWPLTPIDLGSLADPPGARGGPAETKSKFTFALRALGLMKYDALTLSADDMRFGILDSLGLLLNFVEQNPKQALLAANVVPNDAFKKLIQPSLRTRAGTIKLGITAALDPAAFDALNDPDKNLLQVNDPEPSLREVLADLEKDTQVQVLMVQGPPTKAEALAKALPGFEIVVSTSETADPDPEPRRINNGNTLLIQVGKKGKYVGVVGFYDDPAQKIRYQQVALNKNYASSPEPMKSLIEDEFQEELKRLNVVEDFPRHDYVGGAPGATFVGALACKNCHPNTYAKWASTNHFKAYDSLTAKGRDRRFDAECISCHTTGFEYNSGFRSAELTPNLKGNQCENCHGPGSKHVAEPDSKEYRQLMAQSVASAEKNQLCYRCHDDDNSPKFNYDVYHGKIVHLGLDAGRDSKAQQGVSPNAVPRPSGAAER
jgi:hypothetical protein